MSQSKNLSENPSVRVQNVQLYFLYVVYDSYMCFSLVNTTLGIFFFQIYAICIHTALRNYIFSLHFPIMDHEITTNTFSDGTQLGVYPGHVWELCAWYFVLTELWSTPSIFQKSTLTMADKDYAPLSTACVRALNDRSGLSKSEVFLLYSSFNR